jgi:Skp family chaperone for outer membrane proteins
MRSIKTMSFLASAFLVAGALMPICAPEALSQVIGTVNREKIVNAYPKAQSAEQEMKRAEEKIQKLIAESNKQLDEATKANKPQAEMDGMKAKLQKSIDEELQKVQSRAQTLITEIDKELEGAIKQEAADNKVDIVLEQKAVVIGGKDLTDGVVKRLAAAATPAKPATK